MRCLKKLRVPHRRGLKEIVLVVIIVFFFIVTFQQTGIYRKTLKKFRLRTSVDDLYKKRMFRPPLKGEYRLDNPFKTDFSRGQSRVIDDLLGGMENGFFVDLGAGNGETNSVSLYFERVRHWHGILVEANGAKHQWNIIKNRQANLWNFRIKLSEDKISDEKNDISLDHLFAMITRPIIDLLIINLNGLELSIIQRIDFSMFDIRVICLEMHSMASREEHEQISEILSTLGYKVAHRIVNSFQGKSDTIYIKK